MRKAFAYMIALGTFTVIAIPALAETVNISGTHSAQEIKTTCKKAGGSFSGVDKVLGSYGCHKGDNRVSCTKDGKCVGATALLKQQKTTRSPKTAPGQPLTQQKTTTSPGPRPMQALAGSQSSRRSPR